MTTYRVGPNRYVARLVPSLPADTAPNGDPTGGDNEENGTVRTITDRGDCDVDAPQNLQVGSEPDPCTPSVQDDYRGLLYFDFGQALPTGVAGVHVTSASLSATVLSASTSDPVSVGLFALARPFIASPTTDPSWTSPDGTSQWTTPGGDFWGDTADVVDSLGTSSIQQSVTWNAAAIVQDWVNGTRPNDGLMLAETNSPSADNVLTFGDDDISNDYPSELMVRYERDAIAPSIADLDLDATSDDTTGQTTVTWNPATDAPYSDGAPGSGVASYQYRYEVGDGAWTDWQTTTDTSFDVAAITGAVINADVEAVDAAGNVSPLYTGTATAAAPTLTAADSGDEETSETGEASIYPEPDSSDSTTASPALIAPAPLSADAVLPGEKLCPTTTACGTYSPARAVAFAYKWDLVADNGDDGKARVDHDRNYDYFGGNGGDCTNWASQVLKAGGFRFMGASGFNSPDAEGHLDDFKDPTGDARGAWYSYFQDVPFDIMGTSALVRHYKVTPVFVRSNLLLEHMLNYGLGRELLPGDKIRAGDLIFYNLRGTDIGLADHTQVVTRVTHHTVWVAQHSPGYLHTWAYIRRTSLGPNYGVLGRDWTYVVVEPTHTTANLNSLAT
jgi:hypothetical protein